MGFGETMRGESPANHTWWTMEETLSYIGRDETGAAMAACIDNGDAETIRTVGKWLRRGMTIERVPSGWVRKHLFTDAPSSAEY